MLTHNDVAILEFEDTHPRHTGLKDDAIRHRLEMSTTRYYQRLRWLVRQPDAVAHYPQVCSRVQRAADRRREERERLMEYL
jgi:hypothetical protein